MPFGSPPGPLLNWLNCLVHWPVVAPLLLGAAVARYLLERDEDVLPRRLARGRAAVDRDVGRARDAVARPGARASRRASATRRAARPSARRAEHHEPVRVVHHLIEQLASSMGLVAMPPYERTW